MLPDGSGIDVVRQITRHRPALPVVVITGYATTEHAARAEAAGAAGFLAKPFEARELMDCVRRALAGRPAAREERA
jgi:DNA-binding NtrC family response regulator